MPKLIGGMLCLDFVNTVDPRHADSRREYLDSYRSLIAWGQQAGAVGSAAAAALLTAAAADPGGAEQVLRRAISLREALYRILAEVTQRQAPHQDALDTLDGELADALLHTRLGYAPDGFAWRWDTAQDRLGRILWPVARSAADLLAGGRLDRVRECPGAGTCGWLFLDLSKNAARRWCDMRSCGNRAKARRHYARHSPRA